MSAAERSRPEDPAQPIDLALARVLAAARSHSASPEAIAEYERGIAETTQLEARRARERRVKAMQASGVPLRDEVLAKIVDGKLESTTALRTTSAWLSGPRQVLVLVGDHGTGKTTAGSHAGSVRLPHGAFVYVKEPTLARWTMFARYDRVWAQAQAAATLLIDEIGTAEPRDLADARAGVERMVDDRIGQGRKTILSGNLSEADISRRYGARLLDRLREIGFIAEIRGPSMRGRP